MFLKKEKFNPVKLYKSFKYSNNWLSSWTINIKIKTPPQTLTSEEISLLYCFNSADEKIQIIAIITIFNIIF